jgi:alpha/beta superfamily hydrolase
MTARIESNHFQAHWDSSFGRLEETPWKNTSRTAWNVLSLLIPVIGLARLGAYQLNKSLARHAILPAIDKSPEEKALAKQEFENYWNNARLPFTVEPYTIETPDRVKLQAKFFRHAHAKPDTPTVVYFNPNCATQLEAPYRELMEECARRGAECNFAVFDYRNTGESEGVFYTPDDLVVDGASIIQWVREKIGTPSHKIHFYGWSLGGAISAHVKALNPELTSGNYVNERSFSSIDDFIDSHREIPLPWIAKQTARALGASIDAVAPFQRLKGENLVVFHKKDPVIPFNASLERRISGISHHVLELKCPYSVNHHVAPLTYYREAKTQTPALQQIGDFLYGSKQTISF